MNHRPAAMIYRPAAMRHRPAAMNHRPAEIKKRAAACLMAVTVLLFACGKKYDYGADESVIAEISASCGGVSNSAGYEGAFRLNLEFSDQNATLMFAQGSYKADFTDNAPRVEASMTQTVLGASSGVKVSYADGMCATTANGETTETAMTPEEFFGRIIYMKPFVPGAEYIQGIDSVTSAGGNGYKIYLKNAEDVLFPLIGEGIYTLAMINNPQYDLTNIQNASVLYIIDENTKKITNLTAAFTLFIYDTPPYVPNGKKAKLSDYTLDIRVTYNVSFK